MDNLILLETSSLMYSEIFLKRGPNNSFIERPSGIESHSIIPVNTCWEASSLQGFMEGVHEELTHLGYSEEVDKGNTLPEFYFVFNILIVLKDKSSSLPYSDHVEFMDAHIPMMKCIYHIRSYNPRLKL